MLVSLRPARKCRHYRYPHRSSRNRQLGGRGGSSGYFVGAIRALNVSDQGGYPMHYDVQLQRLDGVMGQAIVSSYARIKQ